MGVGGGIRCNRKNRVQKLMEEKLACNGGQNKIKLKGERWLVYREGEEMIGLTWSLDEGGDRIEYH